MNNKQKKALIDLASMYADLKTLLETGGDVHTSATEELSMNDKLIEAIKCLADNIDTHYQYIHHKDSWDNTCSKKIKQILETPEKPTYYGQTKITIEEDGWVWLKDEDGEYGLGDIDEEVTIEDLRETPEEKDTNLGVSKHSESECIQTKPSMDWEESFDKEFGGGYKYMRFIPKDVREIKQFIQSQITKAEQRADTKAREEEREKLREMLPEERKAPVSPITAFEIVQGEKDKGYNECLKKIKTLLK